MYITFLLRNNANKQKCMKAAKRIIKGINNRQGQKQDEGISIVALKSNWGENLTWNASTPPWQSMCNPTARFKTKRDEEKSKYKLQSFFIFFF